MITKPLNIAISSGKGGVGKSSLARSLGIFFSQVGNRTALFDFSESFSLQNCLSGHKGWEPVRKDELYRQKIDVEKFLMIHAPGAIRSLVSVHEFENEEKRFDVIISDLQASQCEKLLDIFLAADIPLAIITPYPESIFETYEFLSRLIFLLIERESEGRWSFESLQRDVPVDRRITCFLSPQDISISSGDEDLKLFMRKVLHEIVVGIVVNGARTSREFELGAELENFARKIFSIPVVYVGAVEYDDEVIESSKSRQAFILSHPDSKASEDVRKIGRRFISCPAIKLIKPSWKLGTDGDEDFYDMLQVSFASPAHEIRGSYGSLKKLFSRQSIFYDSLQRKDVLEGLESRLQGAFETLDDKNRRAEYDKMLSSILKVDVEMEDDDVIDEEVEWAVKVGSVKVVDRRITGRFIRETREKMGLSFLDIVSETKIGTHYLRAIEEENYVDLPELLYVRGFLKEIARILDLDPDQVALSYLKRMKEGLREK